MASKFFEHFVAIADAMNTLGGDGPVGRGGRLLLRPAPRSTASTSPLRVRSMVGLIPLFAVEVLEDERHRRSCPAFAKRLRVVPREPQATSRATSRTSQPGEDAGHGAPPARDPVARAARARAPLRARRGGVPLAATASARCRGVHRDAPVRARRRRRRATASTTCPASRDSGLFGGNSNWRGPVWFPINYLLIEALERYHHFYGDALHGRVPDGLGRAA